MTEARALLAGGRIETGGVTWHEQYPQADSLDGLRMLLAAHEAIAGVPLVRPPVWWIHQIVTDEVVVGDIGFHSPPSDQPPYEVEIGYNVVPAMRRQGVASRACALVLARAWADGADAVVAETELANHASQRVLLGCGFTEVGPGRFRIEAPR